ncbi:MAG TPA: glutamate racemase [Polyangiaceae bacterium]|nr:glutamate racemase [Polyangiaceae bacterium]
MRSTAGAAPGGASAPLGVFDSGLGGLTVVRALLETVPDERIVYLGDTARVPYGTRSPDTVARYARGCAQTLIDRGVKALVVACNTVSAVAVDLLRAEFDVPVLGVVEPGARTAVLAMEALEARPGVLRIGVLGTAGTVASGAYPRAVRQLTARYEVVAEAAPLLVPLVEEGWTEGEVPRLIVERYVAPLIRAGASVIVLGCTHYPLLAPLIAQVAQELAGRPIPVVDSAAATADAVRDSIAEGSIERAPAGRAFDLELFVTDRPQSFISVAQRFLGRDVPAVRQIDLLPG